MLPWLGLSIDDVASVMNLTLVYGIGNIILVLAAPTPHCFYQQMARNPKPVKVYRESKMKPVTSTLVLLKWLIECHKNVDFLTSYPVEKAQRVRFTASGKVKLTLL